MSLFLLEFLGAFIAAALVFGTYYDAINEFDGGVRQVKRIFSLKKEKK
jgi:glycerol uptake facilitator-like aquaporin